MQERVSDLLARFGVENDQRFREALATPAEGDHDLPLNVVPKGSPEKVIGKAKTPCCGANIDKRTLPVAFGEAREVQCKGCHVRQFVVIIVPLSAHARGRIGAGSQVIARYRITART